MRAVLIEPFGGAAGDMLVCALVDAGADADFVKGTMEAASGLEVEFRRTSREHISALALHVEGGDEGKRTLEEVLTHIRGSRVPQEVASMAEGVFTLLARAEAAVHGEPLERVCLHEVGQQDAMADIVGVCAALLDLGALPVYHVPPIPTGWGTVETSHGTYPVPAPAVVEIARLCALTTCRGALEGERLTPTGAALLGALSKPLPSPMLSMRTHAAGYGAGSRDKGANVVRASIVELHALEHDEVCVLETNVDDTTGEELAYLTERLMEEGALDVSVVPALMKKGRMGSILRVIARGVDVERMASLMALEGGTLGVRVYHSMHRMVARREMRKVDVDVDGMRERVRVKVALLPDGTPLSPKAEHEDLRSIAKRRNIPLRRLSRIVEGEAWRMVRE